MVIKKNGNYNNKTFFSYFRHHKLCKISKLIFTFFSFLKLFSFLLNQKLKLRYININYLIRNNILFNYLEHWLRNAKHAYELPAGSDMFFIYLIEQYHYVDFSFQLDMNTRNSVKYYKLNMPWYTLSIALLTKTVFCFILCYLRTIFFSKIVL